MKVLKTLPLSLVGFGLCTAIASSPALADTTTVYQGANCQPGSNSIDRILYSVRGILIAPTSSSTNVPATIVCPINLSHTVGDNSSPLIKSARVGILDNDSQNNASCVIQLIAENGNIFRTVSVSSSGATPTIIRPFDFPSINQRAYSAAITCTLPRTAANTSQIGLGFYTITTSP